jgi:hypothetical protein
MTQPDLAGQLKHWEGVQEDVKSPDLCLAMPTEDGGLRKINLRIPDSAREEIMGVVKNEIGWIKQRMEGG